VHPFLYTITTLKKLIFISIKGLTSKMLIDLSKKRKDLFKGMSSSQIIKQYLPDDVKRISDLEKSLKQIEQEGNLNTFCESRQLKDIIDKNYTTNNHEIYNSLKEAIQKKQLFVLPIDYRIPKESAHDLVAYSQDSLIKLDSIHVQRELIDDRASYRPLSNLKKQKEKWIPEEVIPTAYKVARDMIDVNNQDKITSYSWWGNDRYRKVVSTLKCVEALELRVFANITEWKLMINSINKEFRTGKSNLNQEILTQIKLEEKKEQRNSYIKLIQKYGLEKVVANLDTDFNDILAIHGSFLEGTGQSVKMLSRSRLDDKNMSIKSYVFNLTQLPVLQKEDKRIYSQGWNIKGDCMCKDKMYRSERRKSQIYSANDDFYCVHEILGLFFVDYKLKNNDKQMHNLPFFIPNKKCIEFEDHLRYNTIILDEKNGKPVARKLNKTEIERINNQIFVNEGIENFGYFNINKMREDKIDPHTYALNFKY
jgi:hypothetical protein